MKFPRHSSAISPGSARYGTMACAASAVRTCGGAFTAVDAFYAPVAFRIQSYGLTLDPAAAAYADRLLQTRAMRDWYADALKETLRDQLHEDDIAQVAVCWKICGRNEPVMFAC